MSHESATSLDLADHPAAIAFRSFEPGLPPPGQIETLKGILVGSRLKKSGVFRLSRSGSDRYVVIAKKCRARKADTERLIYTEVLPRLPVPTLRFHGSVADPDANYSWLILEDAGGASYSSANRPHRRLAAEWLALLHGCGEHADLARALPIAGPERHLRELHASRDTIQLALAHPSATPGERRTLSQLLKHMDAIESQWHEIVNFCHEMPQTVVHGDFVSKNLCVRPAGNSLHLIPYDWETTGWGVPAADLAQHASRISASPDPAAYRIVARRFWPHLRARHVLRLAAVGLIFRLVSGIYWTCKGLRSMPSRSDLEWAVSVFQFYEEALRGAEIELARTTIGTAKDP